SSRRRHTIFSRDWSSDVCSSDLWEYYREALASRAASVATFDVPDEIRTERQVWQRRAGLLEWLSAAPRPLGLLAWSDDLARLARSEERRVGKEGTAPWLTGGENE